MMLIYAHRGARGYAPENTMAAFEEAYRLGADGIELDVQLSKDGHVVICHDHTIDRTSNGRGWIRDLNLSELKSYDFGGWFNQQCQGERLLTLIELLAWAASTNLLLNIEIKNGPVLYPQLEEKIVAAIHDFRVSDRTIISSFYHPSLKRIKQLDHRLKTGILFECRPINPLDFLTAAQADFLHPYWQSLDETWCAAARTAGVPINTYTINTAEEYAWVQKFGVLAIFTDYPDIFNTRALQR